MILLIDNFDSFTYNIVQYFEALQQKVTVYKNNAISVKQIKTLNPDAIVIGPGPGTPDSAGITLAVIEAFSSVVPIFGVCLGHQAVAQVFGGRVVRAGKVMHGRLSAVYHHSQGVFSDLRNPVQVTRYHSLVVEQDGLPSCLEVTAWTQLSSITESHQAVEDIMGLRHKHLPVESVQFHPESILSEAGYQIFNNFLLKHGLAKVSNDNVPTVG